MMDHPIQRREQPTCSAAFCYFESNPHQIERFLILKGRTCFDCIQDMPLALQVYIHFKVRFLDRQEFTWKKMRSDHDGDFGNGGLKDRTPENHDQEEYNIGFYYDHHEYSSWSNDFRLVGNPVSTVAISFSRSTRETS